MNQFTVFGFYDDTGLRYVEQVEATDVDHAIRIAAADAGSELMIVAVTPGHHQDLLVGDYIEAIEDLDQ